MGRGGSKGAAPPENGRGLSERSVAELNGGF